MFQIDLPLWLPEKSQCVATSEKTVLFNMQVCHAGMNLMLPTKEKGQEGQIAGLVFDSYKKKHTKKTTKKIELYVFSDKKAEAAHA